MPALESRSAAKADTVTAQIVQKVREGIFSGKYTPGYRLIESDLTREYLVSRGTVRSALMHLSAEGLVEIEASKGGRVAKLTRATIAGTFQVRAVVDGLAARLAAENDTVEKTREVKALLEIWSSKAVLVEPIQHLEKNGAFHDVIVRLSGNPTVTRTLNALFLPGYSLLFRLLLTPERMAASAKEHRTLAKAILAGNGALAESLAREHNLASFAMLNTLPDSYFSL